MAHTNVLPDARLPLRLLIPSGPIFYNINRKYSTAQGGFQFPTDPSGQTYLPPAIPLKALLKHYL